MWVSIWTGRLPSEIQLSETNIQKWQNPFIQKLKSLSLKLGLNKRRLTRLVFDACVGSASLSQVRRTIEDR